MRGQFQVRVIRRKLTDSWKYEDKYDKIDKLIFYSIVNQENKKRYFKVVSLEQRYKSYIIGRDELAFVKLLYVYYGPGDYYVRMWGKGKNRGMRNFWDGVIDGTNKKFFRRRVSYSINPTTRTKTTEAVVSDYCGRYMKTKRPGVWHSF